MTKTPGAIRKAGDIVARIRMAGYVKLAKQWERSKAEALLYHKEYYERKFEESEKYQLRDVYIDITGQKEIHHRPEMLRLLRDCALGKIDCITTQTRGYLAANTKEFCYLIKFLFDAEHLVDLITEDENYHIDTTMNDDHQREALLEMAGNYVNLNPPDYQAWCEQIQRCMGKLPLGPKEA